MVLLSSGMTMMLIGMVLSVVGVCGFVLTIVIFTRRKKKIMDALMDKY